MPTQDVSSFLTEHFSILDIICLVTCLTLPYNRISIYIEYQRNISEDLAEGIARAGDVT
jgi:hypothetical protein